MTGGVSFPSADGFAAIRTNSIHEHTTKEGRGFEPALPPLLRFISVLFLFSLFLLLPNAGLFTYLSVFANVSRVDGLSTGDQSCARVTFQVQERETLIC